MTPFIILFVVLPLAVITAFAINTALGIVVLFGAVWAWLYNSRANGGL